MQIVSMIVAAALLVTAAAYAQVRIPRYTAGSGRVALARGVLIAVGLASGVVAAAVYAEPPLTVLAFVIGFGIVHLPAAFILLIKHARGAGPS
ncbi:MAG: hypothetical protein ACXW2I_04155 [Burkholderiales bacterium]